MEVGLLGGGFDLVQGGVEVAVADVFLDGALENVVFLEHQPDALAQGVGVVVGQGAAVEQHLAAVGLVELAEQVDEWCFCRRPLRPTRAVVLPAAMVRQTSCRAWVPLG